MAGAPPIRQSPAHLMPAIVTLTTDFGTADTFVAQMKGVILGIAPDATLVDITHEVPPQDILAGALALESAVPAFPAGTIHLAVVDPDVGSARRAIAVATGHGTFVAPDNGLLELVLRTVPIGAAVCLESGLDPGRSVAPTFHGRDLFAPAAGRLAAGADLGTLGVPIEDPVRLDVPGAVVEAGEVRGTVLWVDRFGNLVTSLRRGDLEAAPAASARVLVRAVVIAGISRTYADVPVGAPVAYMGSSGRLEIGVRNGSAAVAMGAERGTPVVVRAGSARFTV